MERIDRHSVCWSAPHWILLAASFFWGTSHAGSVTYLYDDAGRLTTAQFPIGTQVDYVLDGAGNRRSVATGPVALQQEDDSHLARVSENPVHPPATAASAGADDGP